MDEGLKALIYLVGGAIVLVGGMKVVSALMQYHEYDYYQAPYPESTPGCRTVALFGDSLSGGLVYRSELEELLGPCNVVQAFSYEGQGTDFLRSRLSEVLNWGPTDIIILAGVNDLASGRKTTLIIDNLEWIYQTARNYRIRVTAVTLTPWAGHTKGANLQKKTQEVNDWISWQSSAHSIVDTSSLGNEFGVADDSFVGSDGLHLTEAGQAALAALVYAQVFGNAS